MAIFNEFRGQRWDHLSVHTCLALGDIRKGNGELGGGGGGGDRLT